MKKLYETQSYLKETDTIVTSCTAHKKHYLVTLQETIFFPEEGGQYADTGWLEKEGQRISLLDGQLRDGEIYYTVDQAIPEGTAVHCVLNWEQRYMRMQQHTGEHILTGMIHSHYGYDNVGFHLSDDGPVTLDMNGVLTMEQAMEMETLANQAVYQNLPVTDTYPTKEELADMTYRSKIEIEGQVRLITIGSIDTCACCAPHVARTGEVGLIKILTLQNYKGGVRISILCGMRALLHYREQASLMNGLANMLSTKPEQVAAIVNSQKEEITALRYKLACQAEKVLLQQIEALPQQEHACLFTESDTPQNAVKNGFNTMTARFPGYAAIFIGDDASGYRYNAGSRSLDARELGRRMGEALGAKGGGSQEMIQGKTNASKAEITALFQQL